MKFPLPAAIGGLLLAAVFLSSARAAELPKGATPVLGALRTELDRSFAAFKTQPTPAYFLSYEVTENHSFEMGATNGALLKSSENQTRQLDIDLRVGDPKLDNTHVLRGSPDAAASESPPALPLEDEPDAIRAMVWYQTDQHYKAAVEQLTKVKANVEGMVAEEDKAPDFASAPPVVFVQAPAALKLDRAAWEQKLRRYSAPFASHTEILGAGAGLKVETQTRWYVNTEGTLLQTTQTTARLQITGVTRADDGMVLPRYETFFAFTPDQLPDDAEVLAAVEHIITDLGALRAAPLIEPYAGPAILSGRAAGVFFHEVFGHRIEGHRQKRVEESQTFKKMLGRRLLPEAFTVYCDPTLARFGTTPLGGYYLYDDEGVKAGRVPLIEGGVFKGFLMSRSPIDGFPASNGHGRKAVGQTVVARQSNLIVEAAKVVTRDELKQQLLKMIAEQKKPYGLLFADIVGGYAITNRTLPNAFNVNPVMVYRIYPDGREELVRGADFIGTPLAAFSRIVAADDTPGVFNGVCGAESGWLPVSAVSPGLLLSQVEVQKKRTAQERLPLLPPPSETPVSN